MESRASLSLPCVPCEPGPRPMTPRTHGPLTRLSYAQERQHVCVRVCEFGGLIGGWLLCDPISAPPHHLTPIFISQAIKHTQWNRGAHQVEWFNHYPWAGLTSAISQILYVSPSFYSQFSCKPVCISDKSFVCSCLMMQCKFQNLN